MQWELIWLIEKHSPAATKKDCNSKPKIISLFSISMRLHIELQIGQIQNFKTIYFIYSSSMFSMVLGRSVFQLEQFCLYRLLVLPMILYVHVLLTTKQKVINHDKFSIFLWAESYGKPFPLSHNTTGHNIGFEHIRTTATIINTSKGIIRGAIEIQKWNQQYMLKDGCQQ